MKAINYLCLLEDNILITANWLRVGFGVLRRGEVFFGLFFTFLSSPFTHLYTNCMAPYARSSGTQTLRLKIILSSVPGYFPFQNPFPSFINFFFHFKRVYFRNTY